MKIRAILRFRNEDLTRKRLIAGFKTQEELAIHLGVNQALVSAWETFKTYPRNKRIITKLESALHYPIEEIFPSETIEAINKKLGKPIEKVADIKQLPSFTRGEYLLPSPEEIFDRKELEENVDNWLNGLREREKKVLKMRFGIGEHRGVEHTLKEVANEFKVTQERIRQIEAKAIRKLRRPSRRKEMLESQGLI